MDRLHRAFVSLIEVTHRQGRKMGLCGKAPTDHAEFAGFPVEAGIHAMSVGPDTFLRVKRHVAAAEAGARASRLRADPAATPNRGIVLLESDRRKAGLEKI